MPALPAAQVCDPARTPFCGVYVQQDVPSETLSLFGKHEVSLYAVSHEKADLGQRDATSDTEKHAL